MSRLPPFIIAVAPNGARRLKADHPAIPLTPDEIGIDAARARDAGAAMVHMHVRDAQGLHVLDGDLYRRATAAVRREAGPDMIVQITTEAVGRYRPEEQIAVVRAVRPEAFSVAVREILPEDGSGLAEADVAAFFAQEERRGALIQYILYDAADLVRFEALVARGVLCARGASTLLVLGRYVAGQVADPADILPFLAARTLRLPWAVCAFGERESAAALCAGILGGHARVGFENNLLLPNGDAARDNAELVANVASAARGLGLPIADATQAREIFARGVG